MTVSMFQWKVKHVTILKRYDAVLVAIGRTPNGKLIDAGKAGVEVDERGFIHVDKTNAYQCASYLRNR